MRGELNNPVRERGFTVTELMVAVSLMSLIVVALYSMFNQTQKALRSNEAQVDVTERGRSLLELVSRELEGARVSLQPGVTNLWVKLPGGLQTMQGDMTPGSAVVPRKNVFDATFYLTKSGKAWRGVGYSVLARTNFNNGEYLVAPASVGALYRYETPEPFWAYAAASTNLFEGFVTNAPPESGKPYPVTTNSAFNHIADGVVHFRLTPFDTKGRPLLANPPVLTNHLDPSYLIARLPPSGSPMLPYPLSSFELGQTNIAFANVILQEHPQNNLETIASFRSNALPAYLDLELGVLEPDALRQYKQIVSDGQTAAAESFLAKRISKVQIFRKRIPLRTVSQ